MDLNTEQLDAVSSIDGYIRVIAGAGSGKTATLAHRFAFLVNDVGILPSNIMCVTFTNKAASEMKQRIRRLIGDNDCGYVCTFHGFCVTLLKEDGHYIHFPKSFSILDSDDAEAVLREVYEENHFTSRDSTYKDALDHIEYCKCKLLPDYYTYLVDNDINNVYEKYRCAEGINDKIFWGYVYRQKRTFSLDYNDLIILSLYILKQDKTIREKWQSRLEYIMVDEFQDIDPQQFALVDILSSYHKNLFIVGDPDQTIYTWRGANIDFINNFDKYYQNTKTIIMNKNYRSTQNILDVSNSLISHNKNRIPKSLVSMNDKGVMAVYNHAKTSADEALWVTGEIERIINTGTKYKDIAILYRAHYLSRSIEEALTAKNIPYTLYSGVQFYCRKEIKDVLAYMRLIAYKDDLSFKRIINVPRRNIGKAKMEIITKYAEEHICSLYNALSELVAAGEFKNSKAEYFINLIEKYSLIYKELSITDFASKLINDSGYEELLRTEGEQERLDNLAEFKNSMHEFEMSFGEDLTLDEYLTRISLYTNADRTSMTDSVRLMTIHTAKGLEFPYVFVIGLNEGIFPSKKTKDREAMEEERRLAYVAFTRAERELLLSDAEGKNLDGGYRYPSRFIFNVERSYLSYISELDPEIVNMANLTITQNERELDIDKNNLPFAIGDRVLHKILGKGTIQDIDSEKSVYVIKFDGQLTERKISFKVKMERV